MMKKKMEMKIFAFQLFFALSALTPAYAEEPSSANDLLPKQVQARFDQRETSAMIASAKADITANIPTALYLYNLDNGVYPTTEEGLAVLMQKPASVANWQGPYLLNKPVDPWGRDYKYAYPGNRGTYDLYSFGPDGVESGDDIANWMFDKYVPPNAVGK